MDEHVTLSLFNAIEANPAWLNQYRILSNELRQWVVNNWIGQWTRDALGAERLNPHVAVKGETTLTKTYSIGLEDDRPGLTPRQVARLFHRVVTRAYNGNGREQLSKSKCLKAAETAIDNDDSYEIAIQADDVHDP